MRRFDSDLLDRGTSLMLAVYVGAGLWGLIILLVQWVWP